MKKNDEWLDNIGADMSKEQNKQEDIVKENWVQQAARLSGVKLPNEKSSLFKFNIGQEVYIKHYKKNGFVTHREYSDNGENTWGLYTVRFIHDDGHSEAIETLGIWLEDKPREAID